MIDTLSPFEVVYVSNVRRIHDLVRWLNDNDLNLNTDWEFYGLSTKAGKREMVSFGFKDKGKAMLFKLTFA